MAEAPLEAAILIIGDEILSGRTQDTNTATIARFLGARGIPVRAVRVCPDVTEEIIADLNALRARHSYVFTTGGIGPTHDDITADAVAKAFGVPIGFHPDAFALLEKHYGAENFNDARRRMARTPQGATLIDNPVSKAPGFRIGNVFVLAGVPRVMQAMLDSLSPMLPGGKPLLSCTVSAHTGEGVIAAALGAIQTANPDIAIGSYPFYRNDRYGVSVVMRGADAERLSATESVVFTMFEGMGVKPFAGEPA